MTALRRPPRLSLARLSYRCRPAKGFRFSFLAYYDKHATDFEKLEFYENLATFRQTILNHAKALDPNANLDTPKLKDFVNTIDDYEATEAEIMRISTYRDDSKAIQVMTAFKSKGLEFKHVFLSSVDDHAWGKAKGNNNLLALPKNLAQIRHHTGVSDDEKLRVLFVAITRAKQSLYLTNSRLNSGGKEIHRLAYLEEESRDSVAGTSPYLPTADKTIQLHDGELSPDQKIETKRLSWISAYQNIEPSKLEPLLKARLENYRLTASDLTTFIDLTYAGTASNLSTQGPPRPRRTGFSCALLWHPHPTPLSSKSPTSISTMKLRSSSSVPPFRRQLDADEQKNYSNRARMISKIALAEFSDILRHPHARAEVNLSPEGLAFDGVPLTGKIDHVHLDEDAKTIEVYDFKTGTFHDGKWDSRPSLYKYRLQLGFYKLLFEPLPDLESKYKITRGHILFVTPDADAKVHDKVYEYNDVDEAELKNLAKAIYHQIKSLDFGVKNPDLFPAVRQRQYYEANPHLRRSINLCDRGEQRQLLKSAVVVLDGASVFCALVSQG